MEYNTENATDIIKLNNAMAFKNNPTVEVSDLDTENILDLKPSYVGKYIVECQICKQHIYNDDLDVTKIEACPYCGFTDCFVVIGQVAPVTKDQFVDDLKDDEDEKQFTTADLVYGEAVPTEEQ